MRQLSAAQQAISSEPWQRSAWTLRVDFPNGEVLKVAGTAIEIQETQHGKVFTQRYEAGIVSTTGLINSLGAAVDRVDVTASNTDWRWTKKARQGGASSPRAVFGRALQDVRGGLWVNFELLTGIVVAITSDEATAQIQCISDLYAAPSIGATRQVTRSCQWKFRDPNTCGYSGSETVCNKIFESPGGCLGRSNQHRYGGFTYDTGKDSLYIPPPDPSGNPTPGGGGIGGNGDIYFKYDNPYILSY